MINVCDIAYVRYQVPDLAQQKAFLLDFGMRLHAQSDSTLYMAAHKGGYPVHISHVGPNAALGVGLIAQSLEDLQRVAFAHGAEVRANDELGAGWIVTLHDPDGYRVDLLYGGEVVAAADVREAL
ncbi:MAG: glyoxalase, partial [Pseudomonas sp.]